MLLTTSISAQRFSASKIKSRQPGRGPPQTLYRAQRFSASKIKSLAIQSCGQSFAAVLNAFQHQRSNHLLEPQNLPGRLLCSTLFSIKDQITWVDNKLQQFCEVLNAFQHQRSNHLITIYIIASKMCAQRFSASKIKSLPPCFNHSRWIKCSTLFSIKDQITESTQVTFDSNESAQRFSASKIKSLRPLWPCGEQGFQDWFQVFSHPERILKQHRS